MIDKDTDHKKTDIILLRGCWKLSLITDKKYTTTTDTDATRTTDHLLTDVLHFYLARQR